MIKKRLDVLQTGAGLDGDTRAEFEIIADIVDYFKGILEYSSFGADTGAGNELFVLLCLLS